MCVCVYAISLVAVPTRAPQVVKLRQETASQAERNVLAVDRVVEVEKRMGGGTGQVTSQQLQYQRHTSVVTTLK